ncbi:efflux transporter periplasmic adaptor subunit [Denitratisoma sp. DHT3]|uniref:efflux RND transporter periplasmic adaptor subunit n=1 Tax=Denitratisoma sp. DHT3 TaxID=1981880 RepID=UPI001198A447|nr:efflux RND transporter periplasmic adaptor subunit [Denitratisoma sp. DHT3]QDX80372.1 efflux transporter periplasmic adaptor subunit [Denitratisoma sp. DHT3]
MKRGMALVVGMAVLLAAGAGYWLGGRGHPVQEAATQSAAAGEAQKKLLYYRNPMGLPDTSPTPKKDPMGMDYVPVYEGEHETGPAANGQAGQVAIGAGKVQKLGVRTEAAGLRALDRIVRAAGRIEPDERRIYAIAPKFEGYVERLHVNATGQPVGKGQPLFEVYSPELVSAQREYAIAAQGVEALQEAGGETQAGMRQLAEASLARLRNWDIAEGEIKTLARSGQSRRTLTFRAPVSGVVTEKKALQGMRFMPGEVLYQVVDLSTVWVLADVHEQDIGLVKAGARARLRIDAYPGKTFEGAIAYVYPTLKAETRTVPVRVELANPGLLLKPGMFAQVELPVGARGAVLAVPTSAVIDSGVRQVVLVQIGEGRYESRAVRLGARSEDYVEVLDGVREGEAVVVAANFLIDAESNLKAALGGLGGAIGPVGPIGPASAGHGGLHGSSDTGTGPAGRAVGHLAQGRVEEVDAKAGTVSISHGPVASLKWPAMTMEFAAANDAILNALRPGASVAFEFVERGQGEWVITAVHPAAGAHGGH